MHQLKILITFNTSAIKKEMAVDMNSIKVKESKIDLPEKEVIPNDIQQKNSGFNGLNKLGKKRNKT